jgi:hypothetical protein
MPSKPRPLPIPVEDFIRDAKTIAVASGKTLPASFESFLRFAHTFPVILNKKGGVNPNEATSKEQIVIYLTNLLRQYFATRDHRITLKDVSTVSDSAVDVVLEAFGGVDIKLLPTYVEFHRKSMAAENKVGELLELYIAQRLESLGWFWCCCNMAKGVDFFYPADARTGQRTVLLQVKNRSNSENSSSQRIRELLALSGSPEITKWYRCHSKDGSTHWEEFPLSVGTSLSEEGFREFIRNYSKTIK